MRAVDLVREVVECKLTLTFHCIRALLAHATRRRVMRVKYCLYTQPYLTQSQVTFTHAHL